MNIRESVIAALIVAGSLFNQIQAETQVTFHNIPVIAMTPIPIGCSPDGRYFVGTADSQAWSYDATTDSVKIWGEGQFYKVNNNGMFIGELMDDVTGAVSAGYTTTISSPFSFIPNPGSWSITDADLSSAYGMTPNGDMIVGFGWVGGWGVNAYTWTATEGVVTLPRLYPDENSCAYAVSNDGSTVVGWQATASLDRCPSIWKNGVQTVFTDDAGEFYCVSPDGKTAAGNYLGKLAIWTEAGGITTIGDETWSSTFMAISDSGMIVGKGSTGAVIWTAETGEMSFTDYLTSLGATIPAGYSFFQINDISPDGKTFTGWGETPEAEFYGAWYVKIDDGVEISTSNTLPVKASLTGNYPNPFNPNTAINFTLQQTADVKLQITNSNGQLVKEAALGSLNNGSHQYNFNGEKLNSGIYFCSLIVNGAKVDNHKMVLTK